MEDIKKNIFIILGLEIEIYKVNDFYNTGEIYNIIDNKSNKKYICKVFDILKDDTKKYLGENEIYFYENLKNNLLDKNAYNSICLIIFFCQMEVNLVHNGSQCMILLYLDIHTLLNCFVGKTQHLSNFRL